MTQAGTVGVARARITWMDVLRGLAIVLVVFHHSVEQVLTVAPDGLAGWSHTNDAVGSWRMPALMVLAGLLLPRALRKDLKPYVAGKLATIAWPYVVWTGVVVALLYAAGTDGSAGPDLVALMARSLYDSPVYLWFLAYLLVYFLVARLLPARARTVLIVPLLVTSLLLDGVGQWERLLYLFAFFLIGDVLARDETVLRTVLGSWRWRVAAVPVAAIASAAAAAGLAVAYDARWSISVLAGVLLLAHLARAVDGSRAGRALAAIGRASVVFYVVHWIVVVLVCNVLVQSGVGEPVVLLVLSFAAAFAVSAVAAALRHRSAATALLFEFPRRVRSRGPGVVPV